MLVVFFLKKHTLIKWLKQVVILHCLWFQVRTLKVCGSSADEIRNFEYSCLGEVRMLGALRHSCIVEMYGHKISSKWLPSADGNPEHHLLQSAIFMEYVKGGSVKVISHFICFELLLLINF